MLPTQRGVVLRTSFVVGRNRGAGGGALSKLAPLARCGLGGTVGSGRQGMSWIHELDMNRLFERCLTDDAMHGVYVASSPNPVSNAEFMRCLRRAVPWPKAPLALPAFEWMVRIGGPLLLRTDPEIALYGRYVKSIRLEREGFAFTYPWLPEALAACFAPSPGPSSVYPTPASATTSSPTPPKGPLRASSTSVPGKSLSPSDASS